MTYARGVKPSDVVSQDQQIDVKILKINRETRKISLGLKQLCAGSVDGGGARSIRWARAFAARFRGWLISALSSNWSRGSKG